MARWGVRVGDSSRSAASDPDGVIDVRDGTSAASGDDAGRPDRDRRPPADLVGDGDPGHP